MKLFPAAQLATYFFTFCATTVVLYSSSSTYSLAACFCMLFFGITQHAAASSRRVTARSDDVPIPRIRWLVLVYTIGTYV